MSDTAPKRCRAITIMFAPARLLGSQIAYLGREKRRGDVPRYSKRVCSSQTMPLLTLAEVYEYPSALPVWRPKTPWRLGPTL